MSADALVVELRRIAPHSEDEGLLLRAANALEEARSEIAEMKGQSAVERVTDALVCTAFGDHYLPMSEFTKAARAAVDAAARTSDG